MSHPQTTTACCYTVPAATTGATLAVKKSRFIARALVLRVSQGTAVPLHAVDAGDRFCRQHPIQTRER